MSEGEFINEPMVFPNDGDSPTVVTHGGRHHADDMLALVFLRLMFGHINIVRTADPDLIARADFVVDVGGEYDSENNRFDHHGVGNLPASYDRPGGYASAGLVWRKYGKDICRNCLEYPQNGSWGSYYRKIGNKVPSGMIDYLYSRLDRDIVMPIDSWDNGVRPRQDMSRQWIPLQWIIPHMDFRLAMDALQQGFIHRLRSIADSFADEMRISHDLIENGPTEFYLIGEEVLVVAAEGERIEMPAAEKVVSKALDRKLAGVISSLREGYQWALFLSDEVGEEVVIPEGINFTQTRKIFFAPERKTLFLFARRTLTAKLKNSSIPS